jgi:glucose-6-phosphate 1-dehydrogenase (EC 1.1.1.49)
VVAKGYVENLRWQGVPFYLMTGKALGRKLTQITIVFREIPQELYFPFGLYAQAEQNSLSGGTQKLPQHIL